MILMLVFLVLAIGAMIGSSMYNNSSSRPQKVWAQPRQVEAGFLDKGWEGLAEWWNKPPETKPELEIKQPEKSSGWSLTGFVKNLFTWDEKVVVEFIINGDLKKATINPPAVKVRAGQAITLEVIEGQILQRSKISKPSFINPVEVIKFTKPGEKEEYRLSGQKTTEFVAQKDGEVAFGVEYGVEYFNMFTSSFHTGKRDGKRYKLSPLKLKVVLSTKPSGKGGEPKKIERISVPKIPGLPDIPGFPEKIVPDPEETKGKIDEIREGAKKYWQDDPDGKKVQEKMKAVHDRVDKVEDWVSKEVKKLPEGYREWRENQPKIR